MDICIIIPAHNEEAFISKTLDSLCNQTLLPKRIIVVNDNSTDHTEEIVNNYSLQHKFVHLVNSQSSEAHIPGSKVINAFYKGLAALQEDYDILCKFDADLIFPLHYLEQIVSHFTSHPKAGMVGGFCYIEKNQKWELENLTNKDHIRGALKAYRKSCFEQIGGLKKSMGWDTADELIAQYHEWDILTDETLHVKHLKPTGNSYNKTSKYKQGEAFYKLRYGLILTCIASLKLAFLKGKPLYFIDYIVGYFKAFFRKESQLVSKPEGKFIRKLRWKKIKQKVL